MWVRLVAVAAAIGVVASVAWWLVGPGAAPATGACAAAEPADAPDGPVVFEPTITWEPADLPEAATDGDEQIMLAVSSLDHGWLASGRSSTGPESHGFVLRSTDSVDWTLSPGDAVEFANAEIGLMSEFDGRVVASGSVSTDAVRTGVWVNRGTAVWHPARGPFEGSRPTALAAGERALLLLGASDSGGGPLAWTSPEGSVWKRLDLHLPVDPDIAAFWSVRPDGDGWLAVGSLSRGVDAPSLPVVWSSPDGTTWTCSLLDPSGFEVAEPTALHRSAQGWLAIGIASEVCGFGGACQGHPIAWTSPDGVRWSAGVTGTEPWHTGGIAVGGSAEGFVAVGHFTTWWSADGITWVELADGGSGEQALVGEPDAVFMTDRGHLVAVGTTYDGTDADAWIATGFLGR